MEKGGIKFPPLDITNSHKYAFIQVASVYRQAYALMH